jgi:hypothetical protein
VWEVKRESNSSSSNGNLLHDDRQPRTFRHEWSRWHETRRVRLGWHNLPCSLARHQSYHQTHKNTDNTIQVYVTQQ